MKKQVKQQAKPSTVISQVSKILSKKASWTKGSLARNKKNIAVSMHSKGAVSFCLAGALGVAFVSEYGKSSRMMGPKYFAYEKKLEKCETFFSQATNKLFRHRVKNVGGIKFVFFNDHVNTTFNDVRKVIVLAKKLAREHDAKQKKLLNACKVG